MLGGYVQSFVYNLAQTDFFDRKINITQSFKEGFAHEAAIYNILIYETDLEDEFSPSNRQRFVTYIKK